METCPKCNQDKLIYDLYTKSARCLQMECQYRERMTYEQYSKQFEKEDKNVANKLALPRNRAIQVT